MNAMEVTPTKKSTFAFLVLTVVSGLMFALGMCMCLLPEWNLFTPGVIVTALGALALIIIGLVKWIMAGKPMAKINWALTGKIAYAVLACLVLGAGMAMIMAFESLMLPGIAVGVVGIVLALGCIPVFRGLK